LEQLIELGCEYTEAVANTQAAFELDQESIEMVECVYDEQAYARFGHVVEELQREAEVA
jgi:hypothetical protein